MNKVSPAAPAPIEASIVSVPDFAYSAAVLASPATVVTVSTFPSIVSVPVFAYSAAVLASPTIVVTVSTFVSIVSVPVFAYSAAVLASPATVSTAAMFDAKSPRVLVAVSPCKSFCKLTVGSEET